MTRLSNSFDESARVTTPVLPPVANVVSVAVIVGVPLNMTWIELPSASARSVCHWLVAIFVAFKTY